MEQNGDHDYVDEIEKLIEKKPGDIKACTFRMRDFCTQFVSYLNNVDSSYKDVKKSFSQNDNNPLNDFERNWVKVKQNMELIHKEEGTMSRTAAKGFNEVKKKTTTQKAKKSVKRCNTSKTRMTGKRQKKYCICNKTVDGSMIRCDNPNCKKWFHFSCVNVVEEFVPTGQWYCPKCAVPQVE